MHSTLFTFIPIPQSSHFGFRIGDFGLFLFKVTLRIPNSEFQNPKSIKGSNVTAVLQRQ